MQRVFLNWDMPVLESAADYLVGRHFVDERVDMRKVLIVVTGSQAKRRLEELLQQKAVELDPAWFPPERMTTIGTFPELLYRQKRPTASDLVQHLAWSAAFDKLSRTNPKSIGLLTECLPARNDWPGRVALGRLVGQLHLELAADRVDFDVVAEFCRMKHLAEEAARWDVLTALQQLYISELESVELWDTQMARAFALEHDECKTDCDIILVGLSDLNRMQRAMLDEIGPRVTSLVFAPQTHADLFDEHGCVDAEKWYTHSLEIPDDKLEMTDTPASQATAVLHWLQQLNAKYTAQEIVIGVPDESVVPFLSQQLKQVGITHRLAAGTPVSQTPVFLLLESLAHYLQTRRYYDLMTLLRHPDVERFVNEQLQSNAESNPTTLLEEPWLIEFDMYYQDHLPLAIDGNWLLKPRRETEDDSELNVMREIDDGFLLPNAPRNGLFDTIDDSALAQTNTTPSPAVNREYPLVKNVYGIIEALIASLFEQTSTETEQPGMPVEGLAVETVQETVIPMYDPDMKRPPKYWVSAIDRLLERLYGSRTLNPIRLADHLVAKSREQLNHLYDKLIDIPAAFARTMTAEDILTLLLRLWASERIPPMPSEGDIELVGWLELLTDDAPAVAITGFNEGIVPSSKSADMFLPDTLRRELQLEDNLRRYARDAYAISAIMASRENVRLIFGKRSIEGDPLVPSRLLFASDERRIAERVRGFFTESPSKVVRPVFVGTLRAGHDRSDFEPQPPQSTGFAFNSIRVTEFRDYLQCPFRYYLKYRLRLDVTNDAAEELDGGAFGDITHRVLKLFGRSKIKNSQNVEEIADYFGRQLDAVVVDLYGTMFRPVIAVQVEQIRNRLKVFAVEQAKQAAAGCEILHVEYSPPTPDGSTIVDVDGRPIKIRGRIDRVDFDHQSGKYLLLDYKTTASGDGPEKVHRKKDKWVDLQLPLYEWIFSQHNDTESGIEVGFVSLPKDTAKTGFLMADWHDYDFVGARERAKDVIRNIREEVFWPPTTPAPKFSELYSPICLDNQTRLLDDHDDDDEEE